MQEEIFGPILPVLAVDSVERGHRLRQRPTEAAGAVRLRRSKQIADRVARPHELRRRVREPLARAHPPRPDLPFGGVGPSGMGSYHGKAGFDVFSHHKSVLRKPTKPDPKLLYPPYKADHGEARAPRRPLAAPMRRT